MRCISLSQEKSIFSQMEVTSKGRVGQNSLRLCCICSNEVAPVWDNVEVKELDIVKQSLEESSPVEAAAEDIISLVETQQDRVVCCTDDNDESHPTPVIIKPKLVIGLDQEESCTNKVPERGNVANDMDMRQFPIELEDDDDEDVTPMDIEKSMDDGVDKDCTVGVY